MPQYRKKLINSIRGNLQLHDLSITRADKGKTTVILHTAEYNNKITEFISKNLFMSSVKDPTGICQKQVKQIINDNNIIPEKEKWKSKCINPTLPKIRGLVILHTENTPIRPIFNLCNSLVYNLGKFSANILIVFYIFRIHLMQKIPHK
jgi:hypothetical protein